MIRRREGAPCFAHGGTQAPDRWRPLRWLCQPRPSYGCVTLTGSANWPCWRLDAGGAGASEHAAACCTTGNGTQQSLSTRQPCMLAGLRSLACLRGLFRCSDCSAVRWRRRRCRARAWLAERRRTVRKPMSVQMMVARSRDASQPARRGVPQQAQETWLENKMPLSN